MKNLLVIAIVLLATLSLAQTPPNTAAFPSTTVSLNLSPITLPGLKASVAGAETDALIAPSTTFSVGETTLTSASMIFAGGRAEYQIKPISTWIQNHSPNFNGYQFQFKLVGSVGVVKPVGNPGTAHWAERGGVALNYAINGQWGLGVDAEWGNFPGVAMNTWTLAVGPNIHF